MRVLAVAASALALVSPASFLRAHEVSGGGFAETNGVPSPELTAWSVLGLAAAGTPPSDALAYLRAHEDDLETPTAVALVALAEIALGDTAESLLARLPARPAQTNQLVWTILALRAAHRDVPPALVRDLLSAQASSGGWSWTRRAPRSSFPSSVSPGTHRSTRCRWATRGSSGSRRIPSEPGEASYT